jgi:hypothetical protein
MLLGKSKKGAKRKKEGVSGQICPWPRFGEPLVTEPVTSK